MSHCSFGVADDGHSFLVIPLSFWIEPTVMQLCPEIRVLTKKCILHYRLDAHSRHC